VENVWIRALGGCQEGSDGSSPGFQGAESDQSIGAVVTTSGDCRDRPIRPVRPDPVGQFPTRAFDQGPFHCHATLYRVPIERRHLGGRGNPDLSSAGPPGPRSKYHERTCTRRPNRTGGRPADTAT